MHRKFGLTPKIRLDPKILQSRKLGLSIGSVLSLMYLFCYIMLSISTYALLFGSVLLFFSLAAMMYASLKIKNS